MKNDNKLYLLTGDGYVDGYGSSINCLGIFSSIEKAEQAKIKVVENIKNKEDNKMVTRSLKISELTLDEVLKFKGKSKPWFGEYLGGIFLGGFTE